MQGVGGREPGSRWSPLRRTATWRFRLLREELRLRAGWLDQGRPLCDRCAGTRNIFLVMSRLPPERRRSRHANQPSAGSELKGNKLGGAYQSVWALPGKHALNTHSCSL